MIISSTALGAPVPGYTPPVKRTQVPNYADDTRGIYIPTHTSYRLQSEQELAEYSQKNKPMSNSHPKMGTDTYERQLNKISTGVGSFEEEMNRIASNPSLMQGGKASPDTHLYKKMPSQSNIYAQNRVPQGQQYLAPHAKGIAPYAAGNTPTGDEGIEVAIGQQSVSRILDMHNSLVRLQEERVSVRRALQRMIDQIGGGDWAIVWDLDEQNAGLPEMEISIYAEEPFIDVLNALLARIQTRSGQPLRVIRYDRTKRLVVTDRIGGHRLAGNTSSAGVGDVGDVAVTETVLKEAMVSLHYDEIPLADALENIVQQSGKGQWRLRMYAGMDQVLKPAHIEEPFNVAMERLLKLFNLKYEIFPGGKLIVVTHNTKFGFRGVQ